MIRFALVTNFNIPEKANAAMAVIEKLYQLGECEVLLSVYNKERTARYRNFSDRVTYVSADQLYKQSDVVIVLGGDGTILETARRAAPGSKPILGFNLGRLGYMAELDMNETDKLAALFKGEYDIEERSMLSVEIIGASGKQRFAGYALNEAVISNGSVARIVDLDLFLDGKLMNNYRADGLIVSTPTGSTAYSMSAGGPVIDPRLKCFCVTPISSHSLLARPVVLPDDREVCIKNTCRREKSLFLTLDGKTNCELYFGDTVRITKSEHTTKLIRIKEQMFYRTLRQKMREYN